MKKKSRRNFLKAGIVGGVGALAHGASATSLPATPPDIEGPFYPVTPQKDKDFDLTQVEGRDGVAAGQAIFLEGEVVDTDGKPIEDATVDLWQANAAGRYRHPHDPSDTPLDPNFQGWAVVQSGAQGGFRFKTILPGSYPASRTWDRTPHIHFKVSKRGYVELTTQMYFPDQPLNANDRLLNQKDSAGQKLMIAERVNDDPETFRYQIVLAKA